MGWKVWVVGATLVLAGDLLPIPSVIIIGKVLLIIGAVMFVLDK